MQVNRYDVPGGRYLDIFAIELLRVKVIMWVVPDAMESSPQSWFVFVPLLWTKPHWNNNKQLLDRLLKTANHTLVRVTDEKTTPQIRLANIRNDDIFLR